MKEVEEDLANIGALILSLFINYLNTPSVFVSCIRRISNLCEIISYAKVLCNKITNYVYNISEVENVQQFSNP